MLKKLRINNFKTFLNAEVEFKRRHLIIGRNNSGKTSLASAIKFLCNTSLMGINEAAMLVPGGVLEIPNSKHMKDPVKLSCTCELDFEEEQCEFTYDLQFHAMKNNGTSAYLPLELQVVHERLRIAAPGFDDEVLIESDGREATLFHEESAERGTPYMPKTKAPQGATMLSKLYELETNRRAIHFRRFLSGWAYFMLNPERMRFGWHETKTTGPSLDSQGGQLAGAIFHLKNFDEMKYRKVLDHARIVEPSLEAINFLTAPEQGVMPFVATKARPQSSWAGLSDGTLRVLAMAYVVEVRGAAPNEQWPVPGLSLFEEPENGMYPGLLRKVFDLFEERAPMGQFIFTSHSPYFIDYFDSSRESVTILKRDDDYLTTIQQAPRLQEEDASPDRLTLAEQYSTDLI